MSKKTILFSATTPNFFTVLIFDLLRVLAKEYRVYVCCPSSPDLDEFCRSHDLIHVPLAIRRKPQPWSDIKTAMTALRLLVRYRPDLIITYNPKAGLIFAIAARFFRRAAFVHNFTGLIFPYVQGWRHHLYAKLDDFIQASTTVTVAESQGVAKFLAARQVAPEKIQIIGNGNVAGVDFTRFGPPSEQARNRARAARGLQDRDICAVFVGRINADKGVLDLITAADRVFERTPQFRLWIIGALDDDPVYNQQFTAAASARQWLTYWGRQQNMPEFLHAADFMIQPTKREGFSNAVLEAQACGLPVIVNNVPGVSETLGQTGHGIIIYEAISQTSLYQNIMKFIDRRQEFTNQKGIECAKYIKLFFSKDVVVANNCKFIASILNTWS